MALRDLVFNILARDRTAAAFAAVEKRLGGVTRSVDAAQAKMRAFGRSTAKLGGVMSASMAPVMLAFRDSLGLYDVQMRAQAKVEQAVKTTGQAAGFSAAELFKMASALQGVTRFGDEAILDGVTAQLLTFDRIQGDVFARTQEMALDMATVLNGDPKSSAIMLGKALNDPIKGLGALGEVGVAFSEDQKKVIEALVQTGQVAEAQGAILDILATQYGGQARAAALAGLGPLDQLKNAWGDLKEDVGRVIASILPPVVTFFRTLVDGFLALPEPVRNFSIALGLIAVAVGPVLAGLGVLVLTIGSISAPVLLVIAGLAAFGAAIYALWEPLKGLAGFIADGFVAAWDALKAAFDMAMNSPVEFARNLAVLPLSFNAVVLGVRAIGAVFDWLFPAAMASIRNLVAGVQEWLLNKLGAIFEGAKAKIRAVGDAFFELWDRVVGHSYIPDLVDDIGVEMRRLDGEMVDPALTANDTVGNSFRALAQGVGGVHMPALVDGVSGEMGRLGGELVDPAAAATGAVAGSFADLTEGAVGEMLALAREGELSMGSFFDTILESGSRWADQMISSVFDRVAQGAASGLSGIAGNVFGGAFGGFFGGGGDELSAALSAIPGLDTGGEAGVIGGRGGMDRNLVRLRLSEGEKVQVTRRGQASGGGAPVTVNIHTPNPAAFQASRTQIGAQISQAVAMGQRGS